MIFSEDGEFPNVDSQPSGATLTLTLDPLSGFWSWDGVPRARESGTAERNKAVGNAKKQGGELSRGQRSRVIPRSSGKVSRRKRSKKTGRRVMKETQKRSVIGRRTCPKCQECRQGGWQLAQPRPFPAGTLGGLDTWLSLPQGTDSPGCPCRRGQTGNWARAWQTQACSVSPGGAGRSWPGAQIRLWRGQIWQWPQHGVSCRWPACVMLLWTQGGSSHCGDRAAPDRHWGSVLGHW